MKKVAMDFGFRALLLVFPIINVYCYQDSKTADYSFVGCYKTDYAQDNDYNYEVTPLTWDVCVRLCIEKDAQYSGIEARTSTCYCSNNMAEKSELVSKDLCDEACYADRGRTCGGDDDLMSMYQLKNTTSFAFLAITDNGLGYFKNNKLEKNFVSLPKATKIKAAYHYAEHEVFFLANKKIWRSQYIPVLRRHLPPTEFMDLDYEATSLALDWVNKRLFWANPATIVEANLDGSNRHDVTETGGKTFDLTVDPYDKKLFFISNFAIKQFSLEDEEFVNEHMLRLYRFEVVTNMAVDIHKKTVYAIGYYSSDKKNERFLVSIDYQAVMFRVLLKRKELEGAFSLNAYKNKLFWGEFNQEKSKRTLLSYTVPEYSTLGQPKTVSKLPQSVVGLLLYHEDVQCSSKIFYCERLDCQYQCSYSGDDFAECTCPENMELMQDRRTCTYIPGFDPDERLDDDFDENVFDLFIDEEGKSSEKKKKKKHKHKKKKKKSRMEISTGGDDTGVQLRSLAIRRPPKNVTTQISSNETMTAGNSSQLVGLNITNA